MTKIGLKKVWVVEDILDGRMTNQGGENDKGVWNVKSSIETRVA